MSQQRKRFEEEYFSLVKKLSRNIEYPIRDFDELDEQVGQVSLLGKDARIKDMGIILDENCRKNFPINDATDLAAKARIFLKNRQLRRYFLDEAALVQWEEFDGIEQIEIKCVIPRSYLEAVEELCDKIDIPVREWFNHAIINEVNRLANVKDNLISPITGDFVKKYRLGQLSHEEQLRLVQRDRELPIHQSEYNDNDM